MAVKIETCKRATDNLFSVIDREALDNRVERASAKSGLGILVDQGGADPINGDAARISGGTVYKKGANDQGAP